MDAVHFLQRQTLVRNFLDKFPCKMTKRRTKHVSRHIPPSFLKSQSNIMLWLTINNLFSWRFGLRKAFTKWIQNLNAYTNPSSLMSKTCIRSAKVAGKYFKAAPLKKTQINVGARLAWRKTFVSFVHWIRPSCDGWSRGGSQHGKRVYSRACLFFGCVRVSFSVDLNLTPRLSPATSVSFGVQLTNPYMRLMKRVLKVRSFDSHQVGNNISAYLRQHCIFLRVCHILH